MVTLGSLHTTWMIVCAAWVAGHVTEMVLFGAVVEIQMSTQNVQNLTQNNNGKTLLGCFHTTYVIEQVSKNSYGECKLIISLHCIVLPLNALPQHCVLPPR